VIGALVVGTIPGTRYAGIAMVAAAGLTVFLFADGGMWPRIKKGLLFSGIAGLPVAAWLGWVYLSSRHSVGGRETGFQTSGLSAHFQDFRGIFMDTVWKWVPFQTHETLLGYKLRFILMGIIAAVLIGLCLLGYRRLRKQVSQNEATADLQVFSFFGLSAVIFVIVLVLTYLFTLPQIDIDNRMLLPLFVSSMMMIYAAFSLWHSAWFAGKWRALAALPWLLAVLCVAWYIPQTSDKVQQFHKGDGLTMYRWNRASIIQAVRDLPAGQPVISNDWELTTLWTGRPVHGFWTTFSLEEPVQAGAYGSETGDPLQQLFCEKAAVLVIYGDFPSQVRSQIGELAVDQVGALFNGLSVYGSYPDGTIYTCPK
jgi:hypothetical protein